MSVRITSNIASLNAQRRLGAATSSLRESFERLSSGLRINRARDDAAGLAISELLNTDAHVYAQGIRNLNDGISLLNVAEGAVTERVNITLRILELAEQAANGTLSLRQRKQLDQEADALVEEYNRIVRTTQFNDLQLIDGTFTDVMVQGGYGSLGGIVIGIPEQFGRTVGTGETVAGQIKSNPARAGDVAVADLNQDGMTDFVTSNADTVDRVAVFLASADGKFANAVNYVAGDDPYSIELDDLNGDGIVDFAVSNLVGGTATIGLGNGDGTFKAAQSYALGTNGSDIKIADVNNDGVQDLVVAGGSSNLVSVLYGNSDGSFSAGRTFQAGNTPEYVSVADLNEDGNLDVVVANRQSDTVSVLLGTGTGNFLPQVEYDTEQDPRGVAIADFDNDGFLDIATSDMFRPDMGIMLGNGDGTFKGRVSYPFAGDGPVRVIAEDVNGDGIPDLLSAQSGTNQIFTMLGNGDGSFGARFFHSVGAVPRGVAVTDVNGDGAPDLIPAVWNSGSFTLRIAVTEKVFTLPLLNLRSQESALETLTFMRENLVRLDAEQGAIGAQQSRLDVAVNNLTILQENALAAASQIKDVDVAQESARLVRAQILQQAGAAILAQANQLPELALRLLQP
ncbi:MAG: VCBS repeat-containing protein [Bdellovibrionales bacterium]|nr:VCBS repeat-containing protein [Bdellovibrionales bacterium]